MSLPPRSSRRVAPSWAKLGSATVIANLAGFLVAIWVARLIRAVPESEGVETALRFGYYAAMAVVAALDALLVDEVAFRGQFRRVLFGGSRRDADLEQTVAASRGTMGFVLLFLASLGLTYVLFNAVNHGFDAYDRRVGRHIAVLERSDGPDRVEAVKALATRPEPQAVHAIVQALAREDEASVWAAWALGRATDRLERRRALAALQPAAQSSDPPLRQEALIGLGRIQLRSVAERLQAEVTAQLGGETPLDLRLLYALGSVQVMSSVPVLTDVLHRGSHEAQRVAAWALAQHRDQRGGNTVAEPLEARLETATPALGCALVESLGIVATEASNLALMAFYDGLHRSETTVLCPALTLALAPDGRGADVGTLLGPPHTLGMKVIIAMGRMRATSPEVRTKVEPWLEKVIAEPQTDPEVRVGAQTLLAGIREGRDDRRKGFAEPPDSP